MQKYDLFLILSHNLSETESPAKVENIKGVLTALGAEDIKTADLGRQKLAYPIKGERAGYFVNVFFSLGQDKVDTLKKTLTLDNEVARYMLSLKKDVFVPTETSAITSVFDKSSRPEKTYGEHRTYEKVAEKTEKAPEKVEDKVEKTEKVEKVEKVEKKEINLEDINKKIDEILQQDNFVV